MSKEIALQNLNFVAVTVRDLMTSSVSVFIDYALTRQEGYFSFLNGVIDAYWCVEVVSVLTARPIHTIAY